MACWNTVLFDFDGTICDTSEGVTRAAAHALRGMGLTPPEPEELRWFVGPPLEASFREEYGMSPAETAESIRLFREYYTARGIEECAPYPGIGALLDRLRERGFTLALATSKPRVFAEQILDRFGLWSRLDVVSGAELDGSHTDKADVIRRALERCPAGGNAVMVGDRKFDVWGARENGIPCVGVLYGFGSREELCSAGAAYLAEDCSQLEQILLR